MTKIIVNKKFAEALASLPREVQKKVTRIYGDLAKGNVDSNGSNLETIQGAANAAMKSIRVNDKYRIVLHRDTKGNYTFLHIDDHDKAYSWAARNRFGVNPFTGEVQLYVVDIPEVKEIAKEVTARATPIVVIGPFAREPKDAELLRLGVPEELIPSIRGLKDDEDILAHEKDYPQGVFDALLLLFDGKSVEEVVSELGLNNAGANEDDVASAVEQSGVSQTTFAFASSEEELNRIRDAAKMAAWRVFLHSTQRKHVVRHQNGPYKLLGGAGTGKTVVAMHRVKYLLEKVYVKTDERILFTTFTKNLAEDIDGLLRTICTEEQMARVDVVNLDAWAMQYLRGHRIDVDVLTEEARKEMIEKAILEVAPEKVRTAAFYLRERESVVLANEIDSFSGYVRVSRAGSGVRLSAKDKKDVWEVLETYRRKLADRHLMDREEIVLLAVNLMRKSGKNPYVSVVVDEAQDFSATAMKLVAILSGNSAETVRPDSLLIVGDAHQRIYPRKTVLSRCGIKVQGRSGKLLLNYRTTEMIRRRAVAMLTGVSVDDLDGATDDNKGFKSMVVGVPPKEFRFRGFEDEMDAIVEQLKTWKTCDVRDFSDYAVLVRTNSDVDSVAAAIEARGLAVRKVSTSAKTKGREDGAVRVATMHRAKGLEFVGVVVAELNNGKWPLRPKDYDELDSVSKKEVDDGERSLLYVAITRAMKHAMITGVGDAPSELDTRTCL